MAALSAITSLLLLGAGCTDDRSATASTEQVATTCCLATELPSEAGVIEKAALDVFGEDYAGLGVADGRLAVFTTATITDVKPNALGGVPIRQVHFNLTELNAFKARLDAAQDDLIAKGVRLVSWGVDPTTNSINVGVASDLTSAEAALRDALGDGVPLTVHAEGPVTT